MTAAVRLRVCMARAVLWFAVALAGAGGDVPTPVPGGAAGAGPAACNSPRISACLSLVVAGDLAGAAAYAAALQASDPECAGALHCGAVAEHRAGRPEAAAPLFERALSLEPRSILYAYNLAVMREASQQFEAAAAAYAHVLALADAAPPAEAAAASGLVSKARYLVVVGLHEAGRCAPA